MGEGMTFEEVMAAMPEDAEQDLLLSILGREIVLEGPVPTKPGLQVEEPPQDIPTPGAKPVVLYESYDEPHTRDSQRAR